MTVRFTHLKRHAVVACSVTMAGLASSVISAPAQDFMERSHKQQGPQPEVKPKVDEKAYKAALEKALSALAITAAVVATLATLGGATLLAIGAMSFGAGMTLGKLIMFAR